jgi:cyclophilin family peptidyl-prolyl cis-trans isomerase
MGTTKRERQKTLRQARLEAAHAAQKRQHVRRRVFVGLGIVAVIALVAVGVNALFLGDDESGDSSEEASDTTSTTAAAGDLPAQPTPPGPGASVTGVTPCPATDGSAERTTSFEQAPPDCLEAGADYTATFVTNRGDITVDLTEGLTPGAVNNFVTLANYGYYDGTAIFRTDPSIGIIQGGSPTTNTPGDPGPGYTIPDEGNTFTYSPGQLVRARSAGENSTGAQYFFVVNEAAAALDGQGNYIVIGQADDASLPVLQQILDLHITDPSSDLGGGPIEEVIVEDVVINQA